MMSIKNNLLSGIYVSPEMTVYSIRNEGMLCTSGSHDPFTEDDSWIELLED